MAIVVHAACRINVSRGENVALSILGLLDADAAAHLEAIECPTLVVAGGHDVLLPPGQARAVHGLVTGAALVGLGDAAHFIPYQRPARFGPLLDFLDRARPPCHDRRRSS